MEKEADIFNRIKTYYYIGLNESDDFILQRLYNAITIIEMLLLISTKHAYYRNYIFFIIVQLLMIYIMGYQKCKWENSGLENVDKEELCQKVYFIAEFTMTTSIILLTKSFLIVLLLSSRFFLSLILGLIINGFICGTHPFSINSSIISNLSVIFLFIIAMSFININPIIQLITIDIYTILTPFMNVGEDNGMNFYEFFF